MPEETNVGINYVKQELKSMPNKHGVYVMLNSENKVLYIGKAKNLKNRIENYSNISQLSHRIASMVSQVAAIQITITKTEEDALLLESNLIKKHKPKYNILLKDDKSFPYIAIDLSHDFPRIFKFRGKKKKNVSYFGPFISASSVNQAISSIQKAFLLRPCTDSFFHSRKRPCMEYEIKRCSGPCVSKIEKKGYNNLVEQAVAFLSGKDSSIKIDLQRKMQKASSMQDYEYAAFLRDRISSLSAIHGSTEINAKTIKNADVIALTRDNSNRIAIHLFFIRNSHILGSKSFFPKQTEEMENSEIIELFIGNFYQKNIPPEKILISEDIFNKEIIENALEKTSNHKVRIFIPIRGEKRVIIESALNNARNSLERKINTEINNKELLKKLAKLTDIEKNIKRIEVYDNSHIFGKQAYGAMIVVGEEGFLKNQYRKFKIKNTEQVTGGDDFAMIREVMQRRFKNIKKQENIPDLLIIDGGAGHFSIIKKTFTEMDISIPFICIAKGIDRNAGREYFHLKNKKAFQLEKNDPLLHYLQNLRDEAHRFAIMTHRQKRKKDIVRSKIDDIPGIGKKRKIDLLNFFGSVDLIKGATIDELTKVEGINKKTAEEIYNFFR